MCPQCKALSARIDESSFEHVVFACGSCGHRWEAATKPSDNALIDWIANVYISLKGSLPDEEISAHAQRAAEAFAHSRDMTKKEVQDYAHRVKRRVENRLFVLRKR